MWNRAPSPGWPARQAPVFVFCRCSNLEIGKLVKQLEPGALAGGFTFVIPSAARNPYSSRSARRNAGPKCTAFFSPMPFDRRKLPDRLRRPSRHFLQHAVVHDAERRPLMFTGQFTTHLLQPLEPSSASRSSGASDNGAFTTFFFANDFDVSVGLNRGSTVLVHTSHWHPVIAVASPK